MISSPYDVEARYSTKGDTSWVGYKVHLTETCDADGPNLITQVETTLAGAADISVLDNLYSDLSDKDLLPDEHIVDTTYMSSDWLVKGQSDYGVDLLGPVRLDTSWQARAGQGFDVSHFVIDWEQCVAICPRGYASQRWTLDRKSNESQVIRVDFAPSDCCPCPSRSLCTRSKKYGRSLTILPKEQHLALQAARHRQLSEDFKERYALRAGVEGTISQSAYARGMRRSRYRGLAKVHLQNIVTVVAINLTRLLAWLSGHPRAQSRQSHFAALAA